MAVKVIMDRVTGLFPLGHYVVFEVKQNKIESNNISKWL